MKHKDWLKVNDWEQEQWGDCTNTYLQEEAQWIYAEKMGLKKVEKDGKYGFDLDKKSVLDVGGGPSSLLLKTFNSGDRVVLDPLPFRGWVKARYVVAGILYIPMKAEDFNKDIFRSTLFDEVWVYNCLTQTQNPKKVIENACNCSRVIRVFEWINTPVSEGSPHSLSEKDLNTWLQSDGTVDNINGVDCYYGVFPTDNYV